MAFSTTTSSRFSAIPGGIDLAPGPTDNCSHSLKSSLSIVRKTSAKKNGQKRRRRRKKRPSSAMQAAAEAAPVSTSFGKSGRGEASHWNWVKSGKRPPKALSALEKQRYKDVNRKNKGAAAPPIGSVSDVLTEAKLRKRLFQRPLPPLPPPPPLPFFSFFDSDVLSTMTYSSPVSIDTPRC